MRHKLSAVADLDVRANIAEGTDDDAFSQARARLHDARGMERRVQCRVCSRGGHTPIMALICASQTSAPSTMARPEYHQMLRFCAVFVM